MATNKKLKKFLSIPAKKAGFSLTAREDQQDYAALLQAKELFSKLARDTKISKPALLLKLASSFALTGNFTAQEKQLVTAAANHEEISIEEFSRRAILLYANKILSRKTIADDGHEGSESAAEYKARESESEEGSLAAKKKFVAKPKSPADLRVEQIVAEIMHSNNVASCWQDKKEITARSVNGWGKHAKTRVAYKSISQVVLKRYFMLHRAQIKQHHALHNIKSDHNRRAMAAKNKEFRQTGQPQS